MSLILSLTLASVLGTFLGNLALFFLIGKLAQRQERKRLEEVHKLQASFIEKVNREQERMKKYAQMEG